MGDVAVILGSIAGSALDPLVLVPAIALGVCLGCGARAASLAFAALAMAVIVGGGFLQRDGMGWAMLPYRAAAVILMAAVAFGITRVVRAIRRD